MDRPSKTFVADRVVFFRAGSPDGHVAFVTKVHYRCANLVRYCTSDHAWKEEYSVTFGKVDGRDYFVNPEA